MVIWEPGEAISASCERPETGSLCQFPPLSGGLSIFRAVGPAWPGFPNEATICQSRVALAAGWTPVACFPTDAVPVRPPNAPEPPDCGQSPRSGSSAQTALEYASAVFPTTTPVCQSDSRVLVHDSHGGCLTVSNE